MLKLIEKIKFKLKVKNHPMYLRDIYSEKWLKNNSLTSKEYNFIDDKSKNKIRRLLSEGVKYNVSQYEVAKKIGVLLKDLNEKQCFNIVTNENRKALNFSKIEEAKKVGRKCPEFLLDKDIPDHF